MSIVGQIGHVMAKDLRQTRWPFTVYVGVVFVATLHSLVWYPTFGNLDEMFIAVVVLGMVCAAAVVQADSPTRPDAFWASQPLAPLAVLGAKLALASVVVIGVGAIGQAIGLAAHGVPATHMPQLMLQSLSSYGLLILFAMIIAALTRDVRTFLLGMILVPIVLLILASMLVTPRLGVDVDWHTLSVAALVISVCGGLALLAVVYRTRDSRRYVWGLGAFCAASALVSTQVPAIGAPAASIPTYSGSRASFTLRLIDSIATSIGPRVRLQLMVDVPDQGGRLTLITPVSTFYVKQGVPIAVPLVNQGGTLFTGQIALSSASRGIPTMLSSSISLDSSTRWLGTGRGHTVLRQFTAELSGEQMAAVARGVDSISVAGAVAVETPSFVDTMPLVAGATITRPAMRAKIHAWTHGFGQAKLTADVRSISLGESIAPRQLFFAGDEHEFALWNPTRREAIGLIRRESQGGASWLVLPGVSVDEQGGTYEPTQMYTPSGPEPRLDDEWFSGARVMMIQWTLRGSYPIHVSTVLPR
jgi:hypothetical protein